MKAPSLILLLFLLGMGSCASFGRHRYHLVCTSVETPTVYSVSRMPDTSIPPDSSDLFVWLYDNQNGLPIETYYIWHYPLADSSKSDHVSHLVHEERCYAARLPKSIYKIGCTQQNFPLDTISLIGGTCTTAICSLGSYKHIMYRVKK
jgi:hypothetical protein